MAIIVYKTLDAAVGAVVGSFGDGDIIQTMGYAIVGKGAGYYEVVVFPPGHLGTINRQCVNDPSLYLKLIHKGVIGIEQAGAIGNGNLDVSNLSSYSGDDDTPAIQVCLDLLAEGDVSHVTAGKGIFNFTTIHFYNPAQVNGLRGNFRFTGAGRAKPQKLRDTEWCEKGTIFKCVSGTGSFDINTALTITGSPDSLDQGTSMSSVDIGHFSVIGAVTGDNKLISTDFVIGKSTLHNISVVNKGNGIAWYTRANANTTFSNIEAIGKNVTPRIGIGFFYDTVLGVGSMVTLECMTFGYFHDGIYIGASSVADSYGGFSNSVLRAVQAQYCDHNFHFGKLSTSIEELGNRSVYLNTCFSEMMEDDGAGILLDCDASIRAVNTFFAGSGAVDAQQIRIDATATEAQTLDHAGKIILDGCTLITNTDMLDFCKVPENSYYSIQTTNSTGRTYNKQIFSMPDVFNGVFLSQDDAIEGMVVTQTLLMDKLQYLHSASRLRGMQNFYVVPGTNLDLSNRPYLPQSIEFEALASGTAISTITVPDLTSAPQLDQHSRCTIRKSTGSSTMKLLSATANMKINNSAFTTQITITAASQFYEITAIQINAGLFYQVTSADTTATVL